MGQSRALGSLPAHTAPAAHSLPGQHLQTLHRDCLGLTLADVFGFQFSDSTDCFCLFPEEEKDGSSFQADLVVEKCGSIRYKFHLELLQGLNVFFFFKPVGGFLEFSQYCEQSTRE